MFPTGIAWLLRFRILKKNGLVFQAQVAYLIPIFGVILGYLFLKELITIKVVFALIAVVIGIYLVKHSSKKNITSANNFNLKTDIKGKIGKFKIYDNKVIQKLSIYRLEEGKFIKNKF